MTSKFEVGRTYSVRSLCDYDCVYSFLIERRTAKTVWLKCHGKTRARRVRIVDGREACDPHGVYSMSPVLMADDVSSTEPVKTDRGFEITLS
jgi:hypothetical protein